MQVRAHASTAYLNEISGAAAGARSKAKGPRCRWRVKAPQLRASVRKTLASSDPGLLLPWDCSEAAEQARAIAGLGRSAAGIDDARCPLVLAP
jgi:hypothetical protein